ncbi:MAG: ABC transporter substrate-binding protein [Candidatus Aramenus sulfurataquae]|uniref:ABC transporter substrate-binding protein n=1 Tax=Candidatus Aramenus sulfurataquae TaxID=1326980 RepID=A0ACC6TS61_9CREN
MSYRVVAVAVVIILMFAVVGVYDFYKLHSSPTSTRTIRIVSLSPSDTQVLVSLGLGKDIVGLDYYSYSLLQELNETSYLPNNVIVFPQIYPVNVSGVVALNPTAVVGEEGLLGSYAQKMEEAGLNVITTNADFASNFYQIENVILSLGNDFNATQEAQNLVSWMNQEIANFTAPGNVTVAYLLWICPNEDFYTVGGNVFINNVISLAGGINAFAGQSGYPLLDPSQLLLANPQVIVVQEVYNLSYTEYLISHIPGVQNLTAYKEGRIYVISDNLPASLLNEPGPLSVYSVEMMKEILQGKAPSFISTEWVKENINPSMPVF